MSIRLIIFIFFISACASHDSKTFEIESLGEDERDSLSNYYKELSYYFLQPSHVHRLAKDTAIMYAPDNIVNIQVLSYSYKKRGEHIKAMEILNQAVEMDISRGSVDALQYRAWSLLYFYRDYTGTIKDVDLIFELENTSYSVCWGEPCGLLKGQALYRLTRFEQAIEVFKNVLKEEEKLGFSSIDNFLANFYLGRCYHELNEFDKAIESYERVLALDAQYTEALYQLGLIYLELEKPIQAKKYLEAALMSFKKGYKMQEPYFERFDEVFLYQIENALIQLL